MDDMSAADFGALVDVFHKSEINPTIGRIERYLGKTIPATFFPGPFNFQRVVTHKTENMLESSHELSICRITGTQDGVVEVNITASLDSKQLCEKHP
ncbi:hypothetical protein FVEN_g12865 [Fusarium venenatum]|uniref:Uncharacterized protein n=1 Tax=Fusarium venenatum TaxID=56646 RepID=A0A2L2SVH8_9HYPO|nr:uncharacterized protein FVRRES_04795 [Fusarium venenatum]KAG8355663.1 hypothetical protein FVEN_g12865 [Fusarium venenatum]CEI60359.1 unnamed protein product [Fusarium venenatum]